MTAHQLPKPVEAKCRCGHVGKSRFPTGYSCGHCYYSARARSNEEKVRLLTEKIKRLQAEAVRFDERARKFRERHPV